MYFITICTVDKQCLFGEVVDGEDTQEMRLSKLGQIADESVQVIPKHYSCAEIVRHCVMPNHVHILLELKPGENNPTVAWIVNQFKGAVTKKARRTVWQKGFHDHVIREERDFQNIWQYIEYNPAKWKIDGYYVENL